MAATIHGAKSTPPGAECPPGGMLYWRALSLHQLSTARLTIAGGQARAVLPELRSGRGGASVRTESSLKRAVRELTLGDERLTVARCRDTARGSMGGGETGKRVGARRASGRVGAAVPVKTRKRAPERLTSLLLPKKHSWKGRLTRHEGTDASRSECSSGAQKIWVAGVGVAAI